MKVLYLFFFVIVLSVVSCTNNNYYSVDDFQKVEKIDSHYHIYTRQDNTLERAREDNFMMLNINTYLGSCEDVVEAHQGYVKLKEQHPDATEFSATFCLDGWDEPGWVDNTISWIDQCIADGAVAVKIWKNVGMEFRNKEGELIMMDDPQFYPVFKHLEENEIPLVGHLGEPKNCWLPLNEMTTKNDSAYFAQNPQYHMYLHPEFPSYEEQIAVRDKVLENFPDLIFIGCHLASLEWSVDEMASFLDRFPNASMDMSARMGQLYYQTAQNREKVRDFFIKYQDRLLYGTDITDQGGDKTSFENRLHQTWVNDWKYFVTDEEMTSNLIDNRFQGLKLPKDVIDKIYAGNTIKWYKL